MFEVMRELSLVPLAVIVLCSFAKAAGPTETTPAISVAAIGDLEKPTKDAAIAPSPHFWDPSTSTVTLHGGRNEIVAFQLILSADKKVEGVEVAFSDLIGPSTISAAKCVWPFVEFYQYVSTGMYTWGDASEVLPDKKWYPEVLIPFTNPYSDKHEPVGAPFAIDPANGPNQGVWIDIYVPKSATPGEYSGAATVTAQGFTKKVSIRLGVHDFQLPDDTHVDGYGEIYGYELEGVNYKTDPDAWWRVARLYHQMAHQHRITICEQWYAAPPRGTTPEEWKPGETVISEKGWADFDATIGTAFDGTLFSEKEGYTGPGESTPPRFWRAPYDQTFNGHLDPLPKQYFDYVRQTAKEAAEHYAKRGWDKVKLFAYIVDEADGDVDTMAGFAKDTEQGDYVRMCHEQMRLLQEALDEGAGKGRISLIWTSHTDPAAFASDPATDISPFIHWWAPNGNAANPSYLAKMAARGDTVWFYHAGHPGIGVHTVNASGVEILTWPMIDWRYGLRGSFWWAMNYWDKKDPLRVAQYKEGEDRWGNGILFYPGMMLHTIGVKDIAGPLSSVRMKDYRRGLQDFEYCQLLADKGRKAAADEAVKELIPVALTEAKSYGEKAAWNGDPNAWYGLREKLAAEIEGQAK